MSKQRTDNVGNKVDVGDIIAIAFLSGKSACIRIGEIESFTASNNPRYKVLKSYWGKSDSIHCCTTKEFIKIN
jgi:hypothetical protein